MYTAVRPWITTGVALVGASVIAVTPVAPPPQALIPQLQITEVHMPAVELSASIAAIFTFPALRQFVLNRIDDIATLSVGLAGSAAGLGQSIALLPSTLVTVTQQVLSGDLLGALTTIEAALVGSIVAIGQPTLDAIIERRQRYLAVRQALQVAVPQAIISVVGGAGEAIDGVLRAFIIAGQDLVDAVLSLNPGNIASALVNGTTLVLGSFADGTQSVVDGIVTAQQTLATALAAQPAPAAATAFIASVSGADVTAVPDLSGKTAMIAVDPPTDAADAPDIDTAAALATTSEEKKVSPEAETPKADADEGESAAKDDASAAAEKPGDPSPKSPKNETKKKRADSPKHQTARADNESESEGANAEVVVTNPSVRRAQARCSDPGSRTRAA